MGKCSFKTNDDYECPNESYKDGLCHLHYTQKDQSIAKIDSEGYNEAILNIFNTKDDIILFYNIDFADTLTPLIPLDIAKPIIFKNCKFSGELVFKRKQVSNSLYFDNCEILNLTVTELKKHAHLLILNSKITFKLRLYDINNNNFSIETENTYLNDIKISNVNTNKGIKIFSKEQVEWCAIVNSSFSEKSALKLNRNSKYTKGIEFYNTEFLGRFDVSTISKIWLENCAIDGLFIRNFDLSDTKDTVNPHDGMTKIDRKVTLRKPRVRQRLEENIKKFKANDKSELDEYVKYVRNMKKLFWDTEHQELYDLYYILDLYYSSKKPKYKLINKIINTASRWLSLYGYSLKRPFIWLFIIFLIFNVIYLLFDLHNPDRIGNVSIFCALEKTTLHHLSKISFFKSPDGWFPVGTWKSAVFVLELLLLIPIFTSIVLGIRKLFKRT